MQKMLASLFSQLLSLVMCEVCDGQSSSLYKPRMSTMKFSCLWSIIHVPLCLCLLFNPGQLLLARGCQAVEPFITSRHNAFKVIHLTKLSPIRGPMAKSPGTAVLW